MAVVAGAGVWGGAAAAAGFGAGLGCTLCQA